MGRSGPAWGGTARCSMNGVFLYETRDTFAQSGDCVSLVCFVFVVSRWVGRWDCVICDVSSLEPTEWVWSVQRNSCSCVSIVCQLLFWVFTTIIVLCGRTECVPMCLCWHSGVKNLSDYLLIEANLWGLWVGGEPVAAFIVAAMNIPQIIECSSPDSATFNILFCLFRTWSLTLSTNSAASLPMTEFSEFERCRVVV